MNDREVVEGILVEFGGLSKNEANHLAGMIVVALNIDCTSEPK